MRRCVWRGAARWAVAAAATGFLLCPGVARAQAPDQAPGQPPFRFRPGGRRGAFPGRPGAPGAPAGQPPATQASTPSGEAKEQPPDVTHHTIQVHGKPLSYTATVGLMPIGNDAGEVQAHMFYEAYTVEPPAGEGPRPLAFCYNGGPGSSAVYVQMGGFGPMRVQLGEGGMMPPPPYHLVENDDTLLNFADLVFVDPVGTGYSEPVKPDYGPQYWGVNGDVDSLTQFIRLYIDRNNRWSSPLFLVGESYGTFRSAALSNSLFENGIALNGIVLVSSVLNMGTLEPGPGNDLPYIVAIPSYTAIAWYHHMLPPDLQAGRAKALAESLKWSQGTYTKDLALGDALPAADRAAAVKEMARLTGLTQEYVDEANLRVSVFQFTHELLIKKHRSVGRYDGRYTGIERPGAMPFGDFDPSDAAVGPPFESMFYQYVRSNLGYKSDKPYEFLNDRVNGQWNWGTRSGYASSAEALRSAFSKNPYMKLLLAEGYYDLATPFAEADYQMNHLLLDPSERANIETRKYDSGHMIYLNPPAHAKLTADIEAFMAGAIPSK